MTDRIMIPLVGSAALILGFAVAQGTGVRWLGGVVLVVAGAWCAWRWRHAFGWVAAVLAIVVYAVAFAVSHPLGTAIGTWPAVLLVAVVAGLVAWAIAGAVRAPRRPVGR